MEALYTIGGILLAWYFIRGMFEMNHHAQVARRAQPENRTDYEDPIA